jgi:hypothetical protein
LFSKVSDKRVVPRPDIVKNIEQVASRRTHPAGIVTETTKKLRSMPEKPPQIRCELGIDFGEYMS